MDQRTPFTSDVHGHQEAVQSNTFGNTFVYRLQVWLDDAGWTAVDTVWEQALGWHYRAHVPPTNFTWLACAEQVAQAIAENCGVSVSITTHSA